jgi:hypothetical protein
MKIKYHELILKYLSAQTIVSPIINSIGYTKIICDVSLGYIIYNWIYKPEILSTTTRKSLDIHSGIDKGKLKIFRAHMQKHGWCTKNISDEIGTKETMIRSFQRLLITFTKLYTIKMLLTFDRNVMKNATNVLRSTLSCLCVYQLAICYVVIYNKIYTKPPNFMFQLPVFILPGLGIIADSHRQTVRVSIFTLTEFLFIFLNVTNNVNKLNYIILTCILFYSSKMPLKVRKFMKRLKHVTLQKIIKIMLKQK